MKLAILGFLIALPAFCQMQHCYIFTLDNGDHVLYQVWSGIEKEPGNRALSNAVSTGQTIRRTLVNADGSPWLAFDVHFNRAAGASNFDVFFTAVPGFPFFPFTPTPRRVPDKSRLMFDVLQQPGTENRVFDTFQVLTKGSPLQFLPMPSRSIPSMPLPGMRLHLMRPSLGEKAVGAENPVQPASQVSVESSEIGSITFSSTPQPGFLLNAVADGNILSFLSGDQRHEIICQAPVVSAEGSWFLWVRITPHEAKAAIQ
jgi:hypothetical protein